MNLKEFLLTKGATILLLIIVTILLGIGFFKIETPKELQKPSLKNVIDKAMSGSKGNYGIVVSNFKTGENYRSNDRKVFETGSLYKLWVMATVYKQIQDGQLKEDKVLSEDIATLNNIFNISSDSAELVEGVITLTVHDALSQMITISHNYAALLLTEKIRLSSVADFLRTNGFNESFVGSDNDSPKSTPADIALFFEKLYKSEFTNQQYTNKMIDLLKNQQLNDGLPKYLPENVSIANKTGDIGWFKHDAGIVYLQNKEPVPLQDKKDSPEMDKEIKGDYLIVVMSESDYPLGAQERIANISKAVYDYFQAKE